jgi:ferritin-like metal-binding protein YciE
MPDLAEIHNSWVRRTAGDEIAKITASMDVVKAAMGEAFHAVEHDNMAAFALDMREAYDALLTAAKSALVAAMIAETRGPR